MLKNFKLVGLILLVSALGLPGNVYAKKVSVEPGTNISQQSGKVTGTVEDEFGPVAGASVVVKGTTNGNITDMDGKFTLDGVKSGAIIQISFIGYATKEIKYEGQPTLQIKLAEDAQKLDEVVVTALGMKRERKALGYSVSSVKSEEITSAGTPMNAMSALYGKTSGLQLSSTAAGPTGGMNIKVRNAVSMNKESSTRPLIVVDGIPIHDANSGQSMNSVSGGDHGTGINDINPEDIESIEILKGAKAAVLYGSEGANGVMLITTKTGKKKGLGIDFGANYSWNKAAFMPKYQNEYGTGHSAGYAKYENLSKDGYYMMKDPATGKMVESLWHGANFNFGPKMDGRNLLWWDDEYRSYAAQEDNNQNMFRTGGQSNINLALSNSGDMGSFRVSYNYRDFQHVSVGASNASHSFSFAGDMKVNDFIKIKANTSFSNTKDKNAPYQIEKLTTYGLPREMDPTLIRDKMVTPEGYNYFAQEAISSRYPASGYMSEYYWSQLQNNNDYVRNHLIQSLGMDVKFTDYLSWNTLGGMDYTVSEHEASNKVTRPLAEKALQGYYGLESIRQATYYAQTSLQYNQTFGEKWNLSGMVGGAIKRNWMDSQNTYIKEQFAVENWFSFSNTTNANGATASRARGKDLLLSVYASAQLAYDNALYLEVQARNDWSSILPPENNNYFYPGASVSWIFTETFELPTAFTFGKVRASWADVGRPGPRYYGNVDFTLGSYGGNPILGMGDVLPPADFAGSTGGFPKPNLKPERKREYEFGFETGFFPQNRIHVDFAFFHNNTYNQIVSLPVPQSSGVKEVRLNAGDIAQNGVELSVNTKPIITKDFTWELGFNLANYNTKVVKLAKGVTEQSLKWDNKGSNMKIIAPENGQYGEIWINPYKTNEKGERIVTDGGYWQMDNTKWKKVGKLTPDIIGGVTTGLTYKNFSLNAVVDFQFGATMLSQSNMYLLGTGSSVESLQYRDEAHGGLPYYMNQSGERIPLDSHSASVPADSHYSFIMHDGVIVPGVKADGTPNDKIVSAENYYQETFWKAGNELSEDEIYKSDYISLRQISLAYQIPKQFLSKLKIQNARVNFFGNNLCYIYKAIPNVTPESTLGTNSSTEMSILPGIRSFGVGLNVSF